MALGVAIILTQLLCKAALLRYYEHSRKEAEAAQISAIDVLELQKRARIAAEAEKTTADVVTPIPSRVTYPSLCRAYEQAMRRQQQKQAELEIVQLLMKRLEVHIIQFQRTHFDGGENGPPDK